MKLINNGVVNYSLISLVSMQGIEGANPDPEVLNDLLQKEWVKAKEGTFRAQLGGRFPTDEEMILLRKLGADATPIDFDTAYAGTLLLGAMLKAVTRRVWFMKSEECRVFPYRQVPQPIYLLGSRRQLDPAKEMPRHVPIILEETGACFWDNLWRKESEEGKWPPNELVMMGRVMNWIDMGCWWIAYVDSLNVPSVDCVSRPANTAETVKEWLKIANPGHYLIVSSQPFCENQRMAVERAVREAGKEGYTFDVCGPEAPPLPLSRWLDNLAKQLWEEVQLLPK